MTNKTCSQFKAARLRNVIFSIPSRSNVVDQLLNSLFHAGRWPLKTLQMNAAIVIDEIHAYDPHTAGLISLMLTQISEAGGRFMVMSATMPEDMKAIVRQSLTQKTSVAAA
ncbi:MAG: hypothetical protein R3C28_31790 [Pirellulaceae bacterium]